MMHSRTIFQKQIRQMALQQMARASLNTITLHKTHYTQMKWMSTAAITTQFYSDKCTSSYVHNKNDEYVGFLCEEILKDEKNYHKFKEDGYLDSLTDHDMKQLLWCVAKCNWQIIFHFEKKYVDELLKDFKTVCSFVINDYRSYRYVIKYFQNDEIAMKHINTLNNNIGIIAI